MAIVTVIVPVYKVEEYIDRCTKSILNQTFKDFDCIMVDDGSPDHCGEICDEYAKADSRIHVIHQKNSGLSAARNAGIEWAFASSDSKWITFIDSDDWVHPSYLEALIYASQEHHVEISSCRFLRTHGETLPEAEDIKSIKESPENYYFYETTNATVAWGKLYKKECFRELRFPVGRLHEDEFITYRLLFMQDKIAIIEQPLYAYFQNDNGIMLRKWTPRRLDALDALEEQVRFFEEKGYCDIARKRFNNLIQNNLYGQAQTRKTDSVSNREKSRIIKRLKQQLRRVLIRYRKYKWKSIWRRWDDLWIYDNAFMGVHILHSAWCGIKRGLKYIPPLR